MNPPAAHPAAPPALRGAVRLDDWGLIRASGDDARSFLHGQLTQDTLQLGPDRARLAGYCSAKGRLLASFVVWSPAPDEVLLACSADLLAPTLKRLSMFVLRAKCRLSDASAERPLYGVAGADDLPGAPAGAWARVRQGDVDLVRLPDAVGVPRLLWAGAPAPDLPPLPPADWHWLEVRSGVARVVAATAEHFVPQMVNLELVGGVNFQKGCYPGQEVVARSQYRGTLKRRAFVFDSDAPAAPGQDLFTAADPEQPAGQVVLSAPAPTGGWCLLAEAKIALVGAGPLHLGAADGPPLRPLPLPYDFPAEA